TGGEFCDRHSEAPIDQIPAIFLSHNNIVLLPQVTNDLVDRSGRGCVLMLVCRFSGFVGEPCAPLGNLPGATHTEPLNLLRGYTELASKLRIPRTLGKPLNEAVSFDPPQGRSRYTLLPDLVSLVDHLARLVPDHGCGIID